MDLSALDPQHQVLAMGVIVIISSVWGILKFLKPFIDNLTPNTTTKQMDAVVISASLADSKPIAQLTESIDKLCEEHKKGNLINQMVLDALHRLIHKP